MHIEQTSIQTMQKLTQQVVLQYTNYAKINTTSSSGNERNYLCYLERKN